MPQRLVAAWAKLTCLQACMACLGLAAGLGLIALVFYDVDANASGDRTVSRWLYEAALRHRWLPYAVAGGLLVAVGVLLGHLFFPQYVAQDGPVARAARRAD